MTQSDKTDSPLVTFILLAYNQEKYIKEAVEAALAQTYQPLEIILSDDCSPDQTFEIIKTVANEYSGPHTVVLNRPEQNLGLADHINSVMKMSSGDLVVIAAGDDISLPHRTSKLVQAWVESGQKSGSIYSGYTAIDQNGVLGETRVPSFQTSDMSYLINHPESMWSQGVFGCTHAWTRDVFSIFGDLNSTIVYEDRAIPFRSALLEGVSFVTEPLIQYRLLPDSLCRSSTLGSRQENIKAMHKYYSRQRSVVLNNLEDLKIALDKKIVNQDEFSTLQEILNHELERCEIFQQLLERGFLGRIQIAATRGRHFSFRQQIKFLVVALMPGIYRSKFTNFVYRIKKLIGF